MWMLAIFILLDTPGAAPQVQMAGGFATLAACDNTGGDIAERLARPGIKVDYWCYPQE